MELGLTAGTRESAPVFEHCGLNRLGIAPTDAEYDALCRRIRGKVLELSHRAKTPHLASAFSCVELVAVLLGSIVKMSPDNPYDPNRDRFVFSKGHAATTLYTTLSTFGFFPESVLDTFGTAGSTLAEQPSPRCQPGVEAATGSLGHGLSLGLGMALASKIKEQSFRTFVLMSDGECNEGSVWEAAMLAPAQRLDNLVAIIDFNKWQATGRSQEVMALSPLKQKWEAFGWSAYEIDGHNTQEILSVLSKVPDGSGRPVAVVANTVKGKGVSFMEDDNNWHYRIPSEEELLAARKELGLI
jgi:transketolase